MVIALSAKNKTGFINGTLPKPDGEDPDLIASRVRNNNIIISWLLNSISKEISVSIIYLEIVQEIWSDLKDRFQQSNGPRIYQMWQELVNLKQNQDSVSTYYTKYKAIWEEINNFKPICTCRKCTCEGTQQVAAYNQMENIISFLMRLNENFSKLGDNCS